MTAARFIMSADGMAYTFGLWGDPSSEPRGTFNARPRPPVDGHWVLEATGLLTDGKGQLLPWWAWSEAAEPGVPEIDPRDVKVAELGKRCNELTEERDRAMEGCYTRAKELSLWRDLARRLAYAGEAFGLNALKWWPMPNDEIGDIESLAHATQDPLLVEDMAAIRLRRQVCEECGGLGWHRVRSVITLKDPEERASSAAGTGSGARR